MSRTRTLLKAMNRSLSTRQQQALIAAMDAVDAPLICETSSYTITGTYETIRFIKSTPQTLYVPESTPDIPIGYRVVLIQGAANQVTIDTNGATINLPSGKAAKTDAIHSVVTLYKLSDTVWALRGDLDDAGAQF